MNRPMKFLSADSVRRFAVSVFLFTIFAVSAFAIPARPSPPRLVNDLAGLFSSDEVMALERALVAFDDSTSNQITVVTVNDLEGYAPAEYGTEIGLSWKVGSEKFDNGIVVLVKPKTSGSPGQVNISVGYGLEGAIPDSYCKRIIETEMIPRFRENDYFGGTAAACIVLMQLASGEISEPRDNSSDNVAGNIAKLVLGILVTLIIFTILFAGRKGNNNNNGKRGGRRTNSGDNDLLKGIIIGSILNSGSNHHHSSGWSSSGGGFGGFGGFGGGSFGGGGASGSW